MWIIRSIFKTVKFAIVAGAVFLAYVGFRYGPDKAISYIISTIKICKVAYATLNDSKKDDKNISFVSENFVTVCLNFASDTGTSIKSLYNGMKKSKKKLSTCKRIKRNSEVVLHRGGEGMGRYKIKYKDEEGSKYVCISALGSDVVKIPANEFDEFLDKMKASSEGV